MLRRDAKHGGTQTTAVVEGDDHLVFAGELLAHTVDEMDLCAHRELRAARRVRDDLDETFGRTYVISAFADFQATFGMDDDLNFRIPGADLVHVLRKKALMDRAVSLPENDFRFFETL